MLPRLTARNLDGSGVTVPDAFDADCNVVLISFQRSQQPLVDSWMAPLSDVGVDAVYQLPLVGGPWSPARRATDALDLADTGTMSIFLADASGTIRWSTTGGYRDQARNDLAAAIEQVRSAGEVAGPPANPQFDFAFDTMFKPPLTALGVVPETAFVTVRPDAFIARFGPWSLETAPDNISCVERTGPYRWFRAIGPRLSFADGGVTFGSSTSAGVCLRFKQPVAALEPTRQLRHAGLTVTVADPDGLVDALTRVGAAFVVPGDA